MVDELHRRGIDVVMYYVAIFADWYWDNHPEARVVDANGVAQKVIVTTAGKPRRFSTTCPNEPGYRRFVVAQIEEICDRYEFEGAWPDMTFWPTVCYCASCDARYRAEVGGEIPRVIDWTDPVWVGFQRKRQEWLVEFGQLVTDTFRRKKPGISVAHQSLAFHSGWLAGGSDALARCHRLAVGRPVRRTLRPVVLRQAVLRPVDHPALRAHQYLELAQHPRARHHPHGGRPAAHGALGTDEPRGDGVHRRRRSGGHGAHPELRTGRPGLCRCRPVRERGRGPFCQDVGIYYSFDSNVDMRENGLGVADAGYTFEDTGKGPSTPECPQESGGRPGHDPHPAPRPVRCGDAQGPGPSLGLAGHHPAQHRWSSAPTRSRHCVPTSRTAAACWRPSTRRASRGTACCWTTSSSPTCSGCRSRARPGRSSPMSPPRVPRTSCSRTSPRRRPSRSRDTQLQVTAHPGAEVLATVTLPYTDPTGTRYASILTDPPGIPTDHPAIVLNRYGRGRVIYSAGVIERWQHDTQQAVFVNLVRHLAAAAVLGRHAGAQVGGGDPVPAGGSRAVRAQRHQLPARAAEHPHP